MCKHQVLPRDTLRMSSKTVLWSDVGGREKADYYIRGGEHFLRTLYYLVGLDLLRGFAVSRQLSIIQVILLCIIYIPIRNIDTRKRVLKRTWCYQVLI